MKTRAAVLHEVGKPIEITELDLDGPRDGEVLIRYTHAGLCHSDVHLKHGDLPTRFPIVLGHEGAGIVEEVGPGVTRVRPGDHVVCSFIPSCGSCHWCATGQQPLCDMGATILEGYLPGPRFALTGPGGQYGALAMLGTFSQYGVIHQNSAIRIDDDLPLEKACLVSCGVPTGWGSAVNAAGVRPGDTVVIYGIGGIGSNAVQGARLAGAKHIIAVDPLENKRDNALALGATHAAASAEVAQSLILELTRGGGCHQRHHHGGPGERAGGLRRLRRDLEGRHAGGHRRQPDDGPHGAPSRRGADPVQEDREGKPVRRLQPDDGHPADPRPVRERRPQTRRTGDQDLSARRDQRGI